jgi:excisionase family DNA binding protein
MQRERFVTDEEDHGQATPLSCGRTQKEANAPGDIMTAQMLAEYLKCHITLVYRLVRKEGLPAFKLGSDWRFRRSDVEKWVDDREGTPEDTGERELDVVFDADGVAAISTAPVSVNSKEPMARVELANRLITDQGLSR